MPFEILTSKLCDSAQLNTLASFLAGKEQMGNEIASVDLQQHRAKPANGVNQAIFYRIPRYFVSEQMEQGIPPSEALKIWCDEAEVILGIYRSNRRCTSLIAQEAALQSPERSRVLLLERIGQENFVSEGPPASGVYLEAQAEEVSFLLLATIAVAEDARAQILLEEIQACSLPIEGQKTTNADSTYQKIWQQRKRHEDQKDQVQAENQTLVEQLHKAQEELEYRINIGETLNQDKQALESHIQGLSGHVRSLEQKLELKRKQLNAIHSSTSWKIAAPARLLTRPFSRRQGGDRVIQRHIELIKSSELFDANWYLKTYPDVSESKVSPEEHFVRYGGFESRLPGPAFNTPAYLARYPDVGESGMNPLVHYLKFGAAEHRKID